MRIPPHMLPALVLVIILCGCIGNDSGAGSDTSRDAVNSSGPATETGDPGNSTSIPNSEEENAVSIADAARGLRVYTSHECSRCHRIGDEGGDIGPDLTGIGDRMTADEFRAWIPNPAAVKPDTEMPPQDVSGEDLESLVRFLSLLK